jgi:hypothetical protein
LSDPHGSLNYVSVGELRAFEVQQPAQCAAASYGAGSGAAALQLSALSDTALGLPIGLQVSGAGGAGPGLLLTGSAQASLALFGVTLLVDPAGWALLPLSFDAGGQEQVFGQLGGDPLLAGSKLYFQAARIGAAFPGSLELSNGLVLTLCAW